jgi:hypothetical protein
MEEKVLENAAPPIVLNKNILINEKFTLHEINCPQSLSSFCAMTSGSIQGLFFLDIGLQQLYI